MNPNTHSTHAADDHSTGHPAEGSAGHSTGSSAETPAAQAPKEAGDGLGGLAASLRGLADDLDLLAVQDPAGLPDAALADHVLVLRRFLDRLDGLWLQALATADARGAAGAEDGVQAASTAGWLRTRLRLSATSAHTKVRTARALFRGPLPHTARALLNGEVSPDHATVLAQGTQHLPGQAVAKAEPVLVDAARRLDPPRLRRLVAHLQRAADPEAADQQADRQHERRGLWVSPTLDGMLAVDGLLDPEAGQTLLAALDPLARPANAEDARTGSQRRADALAELARRALEGGRLPQAGGVRPQLTVTVDLASLVGHPGGVGGATDLGPLSSEACRRLACDGAVTRVLVSRPPTSGALGPCGGPLDLASRHLDPGCDGCAGCGGGLPELLQTAMALLPPTLGGAPSQPLDVGRTTRVVQPAQRTALAVRDGGCVFPGCDRPVWWCEAHHLWHWVDGGPTDLANLVLVCRAHHRALHEGGWRLVRGPDGRCTATPPDRHRHRHRRSRAAA
jgi:Domain of unknown function (DUF222)/HNH endonuclease